VEEQARDLCYERLLCPYMKGVIVGKVCDFYVGLQYEIYKFMRFCEIGD